MKARQPSASDWHLVARVQPIPLPPVRWMHIDWRVCLRLCPTRLSAAKQAQSRRCARPSSRMIELTMRMARFLVILGAAILVIGLLWPHLSRIGLGRLPGDIVSERDNFTLHLPLTTCLLINLLFSVVLWLLNR